MALTIPLQTLGLGGLGLRVSDVAGVVCEHCCEIFPEARCYGLFSEASETGTGWRALSSRNPQLQDCCLHFYSGTAVACLIPPVYKPLGFLHRKREQKSGEMFQILILLVVGSAC